ncbi:MAG: hypothetical protein AAGM67_04855 [Bacteroidota bacterium]
MKNVFMVSKDEKSRDQLFETAQEKGIRCHKHLEPTSLVCFRVSDEQVSELAKDHDFQTHEDIQFSSM